MLKYLIVSLLAIEFGLFSNSYVVYKTLKMQCFSNPEFIRNVTCQLKPINWYKSVSSVQFDIINKLTNVTLHVQSFVKNYANVYKPFILSGTGNMCDIFDKKRFPAIAALFIKLMKTMSNVNHSCPYTGHVILKDLYLNEELVPFVLPYGVYKGVFSVYEGYPFRNVGSATYEIQVMEKLKLRNDGSDPSRKRKVNATKS